MNLSGAVLASRQRDESLFAPLQQQQPSHQSAFTFLSFRKDSFNRRSLRKRCLEVGRGLTQTSDQSPTALPSRSKVRSRGVTAMGGGGFNSSARRIFCGQADRGEPPQEETGAVGQLGTFICHTLQIKAPKRLHGPVFSDG